MIESDKPWIKPWTTSQEWGDCRRCETIGVRIAFHVCPPAYRVFDPACCEEFDAVEVRAHDAESAALKYAERHDPDRHEYSILRDGLTVLVVSPTGERQRFELTGESVPSYSAEAVNE